MIIALRRTRPAQQHGHHARRPEPAGGEGAAPGGAAAAAADAERRLPLYVARIEAAAAEASFDVGRADVAVRALLEIPLDAYKVRPRPRLPA
eukprot:tig00000269_g23714.t1